MRYFKLLVLGGMVLALSSPAWAMMLTGYTPGDPLYLHFNSVDVGPVYNYGTATTEAAANALQATAAPGLQIPGEDAWGVAYVSNITNPNNSVTYWSAATSGTELTALFFGTRDQSISFVQGTQTYVIGGQTYRDDTLQTFSNGFKFFIWEDSTPDYSNAGGPTARTGAYTYPTVSDGTLLLEAIGVAGKPNTIAGSGVVEHEAHVTYQMNVTGSPFIAGVQSGSGGSTYAQIADANGDSIVTGTGFDNNGFLFGAADIQIDWTLTLPGLAQTTPWWDLANQDPAQMTFIPEPATLTLLALGGLALLQRRRR